ncbi:PHF20 protein, partial [Polyodon spathula]|nr:PHF20 protein [Polyodon spathula]
MSKNPPNRRGIIFEVGAHLEARDTLKNWYAANIEKIDYEEEKVLIHYRQWSHRYDEWFEWSSPYLRPVERIQLRKEGLQEGEVQAEFRVNEKVLASWTDCRFYPAKVLSVNRDLSSYTVKFYDGVIQAVKGIHVKPYRSEKSGGKSKIEDKQKEKVCDKEKSAMGHKVREKLIDIKEQNSTPKSKKSKRNETENKRDAAKEEDDRNVPVKGEVREESKKPKRGFTSDMVKEERKVSRVKTVDKKKTVETKKKEEEKNMESGHETTEKNVTSAEQETRSKESKQDNGLAEEKSQQPEETQMENKDAENSETEAEKQTEPEEKVSETATETAEGSGDGTGDTGKEEDRAETSEQKGRAEETKENEAADTTTESTEDREPAAELGDSEPAEQSPDQAVKKRGRPPSRAKSPDNQYGVLELRKRKISLGAHVPSKRTKLDTNADQGESAELKSAVDSSGQSQEPSNAVPESPAAPSSEKQTREEGAAPNETPTTALKAEPGKLHTETAPVVKRQPQPPNPNKYSREPLYTAIKRSQDSLSPKALTIDLDHTFKCKVPDCLKSFRKAKLLHYHMKYYHGEDKAAESEQSPTKRSIQTRASEKQAALENPKRRRTISASLHSKVGKLHERRRTSAPPAVNTLHNHRPSLREKSKENQLEKSNRKQQEKEKDKDANDTVKEKEKIREKKHREFLRVKLKRKKKKKKKSKSDEDTVSDSSTDSLLWSEDELGQDVDVTMNLHDDGPNEGRREFEIVRCICEVQEENDFMIQCEECLCWQHGVCMGLLEDNVPEKYTCYICRDPPGQRQSLKYWYDKDWLSNGHMYGLSFLEENYSHQNAKKIAATHQLLGDVHRVIEVLNGLQLKMSILQSKAHPDLKFRCPSWKQVDSKEKPRKRQATAAGLEEGEDREISSPEKPCPIPCIQESYITSEHCYQKPHTYYPAVEQRLVVETRSSELEERMRGVRENGEDLLALEQRYGRSPDQDRRKADWESRLENEQDQEAEVSKRSCSGESCNVKVAKEDRDGDMNFQQQWQINLMDHIEAVQDEVIHRMDFIERELDVLESWLDYTGELEPPEPLARLPQLKHRIKQLLTELGKVQQIALCCST